MYFMRIRDGVGVVRNRLTMRSAMAARQLYRSGLCGKEGWRLAKGEEGGEGEAGAREGREKGEGGERTREEGGRERGG